MTRMGRPGLSAEQKRELWTRWKEGWSLSDIGRALGKHAGSVFGIVLAKGGIAPPLRTRSRLSLRPEEREEISRGLMAGWSFHQIAAQLGRSPSTIRACHRLIQSSVAARQRMPMKDEAVFS